jgi:hypothetical protein
MTARRIGSPLALKAAGHVANERGRWPMRLSVPYDELASQPW